MAPPAVPGPIPRYMIYIGDATYTGINVHDVKVEDRLNQVGNARVTLNLTHSTLITDGGNILVLDQTNNLPLTGYVLIDEEVIRYTTRTYLNPLTRLEEEWALYVADPEGYTLPEQTKFTLNGLTRGCFGTAQGTHGQGRKVIIYPGPVEGDDIRIFLGGRHIFQGVVSHVERDEDSNDVRLEAVGAATKIRDIQVTSKTLYTETMTGILLEGLKPPGDSWTTDIETGVKMNYRMELGNNLMHLANLCLLSGLDWWVSTDPETGVHTIHCRSHRGDGVSKATWTARLNAFNLKRSASKEDIYNSITAIGSSQEMQGASTVMNANTIRMTTLTSSETTLAENIIEDDTSFEVVNSSSYAVGDTIQIGTEKMEVASKPEENVLGVTRAYGGTTATAHYAGDPVLQVTKLVIASEDDLNQDEGYPATVWIGSEKIDVTGVYGNQLQALTRGIDGTTPYAHRAGTLVLSADATNEEPEETSSIGYYGVRGMRQSVIGVVDMDGLDKYAGKVLMQLKDLLPGGAFQVKLGSFPEGMGIGDLFTLLEYGVAGSADHRVTGLVWDTSGTVTVEYGHPEEWILADFRDAAKAMQLATQRTPPAAQAPVVQLSEDGKMAQVMGPDGPIWVRMQL